MSGDEANSPGDPEEVLGLASGERAAAEARDFPAAICGGLAIVIPFIGFFIGWMLGSAMQRHDGSGAAWAPIGLLWISGVSTAASLVGVGLAIFALWRLERWPLLAAFALVMNGGLLLRALAMLCP